MTQKELSKLLHDTGCPVNEGVSSIKNEKVFPRIDYWEMLWEDVMASGDDYSQEITWQISFYAKRPRNPKLMELKELLNELGYHPTIAHEYVIEDRVWHSYFSITTDAESL
ncbi:hypothetical protein [Coprococcus sp. LG101-27]|jgi:hypothetical protein|uniref:hypothetical protein n=1 Tax=Coprococcus sp. LG101-27 TaxID=2997954 RepID=UPI0022E588F6|nr:hypothetical protein [Coprococcus sp. LG101-27]